MRLPDMLPADLQASYGFIEDEKELFEQLKSKSKDLVAFFCCACNDEIWVSQSKDFIDLSLYWLTEQLLKDAIHVELCQDAVKAVKANISLLKSKLPLNILCRLLDGDVPISSLMFQASSTYFYHLIRKECRDKGKKGFTLNNVFLAEFETIQNFVYAGKTDELWKYRPEELLIILELAQSWQLEELKEASEELYAKGVSEETAFEALKLSQKQMYEVIKAYSIAKINALHLGLQLASLGPRQLSCEVAHFSEVTLTSFEKIASYVTEIICCGKVIQEKEFIGAVAQCPKLIGLDLSQTLNFDDNLKLLPQAVRELKLCACAWLDNSSLKTMILLFPSLEKLDVSGNSQLSAGAFGHLLKLTALKELILSRCSNLNDDELLLVLNSSRRLESLDISECRKITERGFHHIAVSNKNFYSLNMGRTHITDSALLEILSKMPSMNTLDVTRCAFLSEQGLFEALKGAVNLRFLNLTGCSISQSFIEDLQKQRPYIQVTW